MGTNGFTWNRAAMVGDRVNANSMHATFFKVDAHGLAPFEFAKGPSPIDKNNINIPPEFVTEFAMYLIANELTSLMALEVGDFAHRDPDVKTAELEVQWGDTAPFTIVVPVSFLAGRAGPDWLERQART